MAEPAERGAAERRSGTARGMAGSGPSSLGDDRAGRAFHIAREARTRFDVQAIAGTPRGDLPVTDIVAIRRLAARMNAARPAGSAPIFPGQIAALAILHELGHLLLDGAALDRALASLRQQLGGAADGLLDAFSREFPPVAPAADPETAEDRLAELILLRVANENPAAAPLRDLVDERPLTAVDAYPAALRLLERWPAPPKARRRPGVATPAILELLRAPAASAPDSLAAQLRFAREHWLPLVGPTGAQLLGMVDAALGELAEEAEALHRGFGGPDGGFGGPDGGLPGGGARPGGGSSAAPSLDGLDAEVEAFSRDEDWMPGLVLQARSTYVWLEQLSRRHGRSITRLDEIPDEELDRLARWGVSGLWMIGIWQRSRASGEIKRRRGDQAALASAYALDDYRVAADLGGPEALGRLRERALARGIRLACDMVPNHMGIDSGWVMEHPEWFLSLPEPPYPSYSFDGPDLSHDDRAEIVLEDHYWDGSDAAVVFRRRDRRTGETRFIYHGNDGTSYPWNDTAQLDFLRAEVREQVVRTILDVARQFPVIRFDAAMVLARRHVQRLWWPEPGSAGGIPSRSAHALSRAEFNRLMPAEFWREVVDRVAAEVPGTLLLAEAFWLMEGYFVRTLGMHRVYNSAFMHMLRDEDIAAYRRLIRETLEFDPEILERYVNFMSNPDEESAVEQFGRGEKAFGVATVLATIPGLPMLAHGQVEGLAERYGMEFSRARWTEEPDAAMTARHEAEIAPLLRERSRYANARTFRLYDLVGAAGAVDESVLAYSNGDGDERSLVVYHGRDASTGGRLRESAPFAVKQPDGSRTVERQLLVDALGLAEHPDALVAYRDRRSGLEHLHRIRTLRDDGLRLALAPYGCHVFERFRVVPASPGRWAELADHLDGAGVPSLDEALLDLELASLHGGLRELLSGPAMRVLGASIIPPTEPAAHVAAAGTGEGGGAASEASGSPASGAAPGASVGRTPRPARPLPALDQVAATEQADRDRILQAIASWDRELRLEAARRGVPDRRSPSDPRSPRDRLAGAAEASRRARAAGSGVLSTVATGLEVAIALALGAGSTDSRSARDAGARFDACRLHGTIEAALGTGLEGAASEGRAVTRIRALLSLPGDWRAAEVAAGAQTPAAVATAVARDWLAAAAARDAAGLHHWDGQEWLIQEEWERLVERAAALRALNASSPAEVAAIDAVAAALRRAAVRAGFRADLLPEAAGDGARDDPPSSGPARSPIPAARMPAAAPAPRADRAAVEPAPGSPRPRRRRS